MTKEEKNDMIVELTETLSSSNVVYLTDTAGITVETANDLRRTCFKNNVSLRVVKNTLLRKAMEKVEGKDFSELYELLSGPTAIMISDAGNAPAKLIKEFRKKSEKPVIKGAYIEEAVYIGDQVDALAAIKSKEELIGDVILLLQSPIKNVVGSLQSGQNTLSGLIKALEERAQ